MGFRTPNFQQFQQPQQQKQFQEQDRDLQPVGKRQKGTGFTNIGRILGANIGAGERMGRQVGQAVGMQAGQARAGVTEAQKKYQEDKAAAEKKARDALGGVGQYLDNTTGLAGMTEEEAKKAREAFTKEGQYAGPKGLEQEAQLKARAEALGDVATMGMAGRGGRQQLTRSLVAGPGMYTRGQSLLDATLLGQSAAAQRAIEAGSRQALGVQQDIAETIGSTREQSKAAESAISKEKADIGKKVGEKFEKVGTEGEKAAQQFADDINRFKQLLTAEKSTDKDGNIIYKDPVTKNIINVTDRDRELALNPEQFGLNTSDIYMDPRAEYSDISKGILGDIALQGAFTYQKGMKKYTPEQEAMARNLALLKGETPQEYKPFETDIFKTSGENIAEKSESYRGFKDAQKRALDDISSSYTKKIQEIAPYFNVENLPTQVQLMERDLGQIGSPDQADAYLAYINQLKNLYSQYENAIKEEKTTQKGISLKDYLQNLYNKREQ